MEERRALILADISEFQSDIDAPTYLKTHQNVICRVHNGVRPDHKMPGRLEYLRAHHFNAVGLYQIMDPLRSVSAQADDFMATVGTLQANEFPVLDCELGSVDQILRAETWFTIIDAWANMLATLYSDLAFLNERLGGADRWGKRPIWVAAYDQREPDIRHALWQYASNVRYDAVTPPRCDSSIFHGDNAMFLRTMRRARTLP